MERLKYWLSSDWAPLKLAILGVILAAPSLWVGLVLDDFAHRAAFLGTSQVSGFMVNPWLMFTFTDGNPEHTQAARETGFFPWWTSDTILLNFWRPVTAFTHLIDYTLWPNLPVLMHLQNLFWFFATILLVSRLYQRIGVSALTAGLAGLIFVLDESHGLPVAWVANRNAMLALFWGMLCLLCHIRWRDSRRRLWLAAAVLALMVSVHCNEGGIATTGYLFAFALFMEKGNWRGRIVALAPYAVAVIVWRLYYQAMGFGVMGSPTYVDPGTSPIRFAEHFFWRSPVLMLAQLTNLPSEPFGFLPFTLRVVHWGIAVGTIGVFAMLFLPLLRTSERARFWTLAMFLSAVPASATFPSGRLLIFASVGGAGLVAEYLTWVWSKPKPQILMHRLACAALLVVHVLLAPLGLVGTSAALIVGSKVMTAIHDSVEYPADIANRTLFLINPPTYLITTYTNVRRELEGMSVPNGTHILSANSMIPVEMTVTRVDEDTLHVAPDGGFPWLLFRDVSDPFQAGDRVELEHLVVEILHVNGDGVPTDVNYHFSAPLESESFYWLQMNERGGYEEYAPPAIGDSVVFYEGNESF